MDKEKLRQEANKARVAAITLAENIYRYLGGVISRTELKSVVDSIISEEHITRFNHMYIKKDTYNNTLINGFLQDDTEVDIDDSDTLTIKDIEDSQGE